MMRDNRLTLDGARVLVLEDDFYLATDLQSALAASGAVPVGPFGDEQEALARVGGEHPHCALLDVNLGSGPSYVLADRLAELSIPFAFITGYDQEKIPARHQHVLRAEKPVELSHVPALILRLLDRSG